MHYLSCHSQCQNVGLYQGTVSRFESVDQGSCGVLRLRQMLEQLRGDSQLHIPNLRDRRSKESLWYELLLICASLWGHLPCAGLSAKSLHSEMVIILYVCRLHSPSVTPTLEVPTVLAILDQSQEMAIYFPSSQDEDCDLCFFQTELGRAGLLQRSHLELSMAAKSTRHQAGYAIQGQQCAHLVMVSDFQDHRTEHLTQAVTFEWELSPNLLEALSCFGPMARPLQRHEHLFDGPG